MEKEMQSVKKENKTNIINQMNLNIESYASKFL